jgi:hypothetical protein
VRWGSGMAGIRSFRVRFFLAWFDCAFKLWAWLPLSLSMLWALLGVMLPLVLRTYSSRDFRRSQKHV